jgi:hypothetical protein
VADRLALPDGWRLAERCRGYSYDLYRTVDPYDERVAHVGKGFWGWHGSLAIAGKTGWSWTAPTRDDVVRQVLRHLGAVGEAGQLAEDRIEWGHRLAASYPGRDRFNDADDVRSCWDSVTRSVRATPCDDPTSNGYPQDHLWRRVTVTEWQAGGNCRAESHSKGTWTPTCNRPRGHGGAHRDGDYVWTDEPC